MKRVKGIKSYKELESYILEQVQYCKERNCYFFLVTKDADHGQKVDKVYECVGHYSANAKISQLRKSSNKYTSITKWRIDSSGFKFNEIIYGID